MADGRSSKPPGGAVKPYRDACASLADTLGYAFEEVWDIWQLLARIHQYERPLPKDAAQERAWLDLRVLLDKRGKTTPS
jgi:hypothetical protein